MKDIRKMSLGGGMSFVVEMLYNIAEEASGLCYIATSNAKFPIAKATRRFNREVEDENRTKFFLENNEKRILEDLGSAASKKLEKALEITRQMEAGTW